MRSRVLQRVRSAVVARQRWTREAGVGAGSPLPHPAASSADIRWMSVHSPEAAARILTAGLDGDMPESERAARKLAAELCLSMRIGEMPGDNDVVPLGPLTLLGAHGIRPSTEALRRHAAAAVAGIAAGPDAPTEDAFRAAAQEVLAAQALYADVDVTTLIALLAASMRLPAAAAPASTASSGSSEPRRRFTVAGLVERIADIAMLGAVRSEQADAAGRDLRSAWERAQAGDVVAGAPMLHSLSATAVDTVLQALLHHGMYWRALAVLQHAMSVAAWRPTAALLQQLCEATADAMAGGSYSHTPTPLATAASESSGTSSAPSHRRLTPSTAGAAAVARPAVPSPAYRLQVFEALMALARRPRGAGSDVAVAALPPATVAALARCLLVPPPSPTLLPSRCAAWRGAAGTDPLAFAPRASASDEVLAAALLLVRDAEVRSSAAAASGSGSGVAMLAAAVARSCRPQRVAAEAGDAPAAATAPARFALLGSATALERLVDAALRQPGGLSLWAASEIVALAAGAGEAAGRDRWAALKAVQPDLRRHDGHIGRIIALAATSSDAGAGRASTSGDRGAQLR